MKQTRRVESGFTIVELMIALAFLSVMLLFILSATVQVMRSYSKGLTIKQINQTGRSITEDIVRTARTATTDSVDTTVLDQGRFCIGGVSYVWNEPEVMGDTNITGNKFSSGSPNEVDIVRVVDASSPPQYCSNTATTVDRGSSDTSILSNGSIRLLNMQVEESADRKLINIKFSIASIGADKPIKVGTNYQCPTDSPSLFGTFCAVADFETSVFLRNSNGE